MTAHDTDEWRAAIQESNAAPRPEPDEYEGSADGPSNAVYSATQAAAEAERWGDPICERCGENELTFVEPICGECIESMEQEEAHDRSMAGEW